MHSQDRTTLCYVAILDDHVFLAAAPTLRTLVQELSGGIYEFDPGDVGNLTVLIIFEDASEQKVSPSLYTEDEEWKELHLIPHHPDRFQMCFDDEVWFITMRQLTGQSQGDDDA